LFTAEHVDAKLKAGTAQGYKIALEKLRAAHGGIKASQLTRAQVAALHAQMRGNPYGANRFLAITSKLYSWASEAIGAKIAGALDDRKPVQPIPLRGRK